MTDTKKDNDDVNSEAEIETPEDLPVDLEAAADDFLKAVELEEGDPMDETAEDPADEPAEDGGPPTYEELQEQAATLKDQLLRALAEADNTRRRTEREKADMSKYAVTNFARSVLSVADNLRRALDSVSQDARDGDEALNSLCVGVEMTEKEIDATYEQFGIKTIDAEGKRFDHNLHQAMFEIDAPDQPAGMVLKVMQKGYVIHDRLLRPAMVGVSKGGAKLEKEVAAETAETAEAPVERRATTRSQAYEKQSDAADQEGDGTSGQVDKEL
jgi:molecular chaperone GrpE